MTRRLIDLSYSIHEGMTSFPTHWHPIVEITQLGRHGLENRETRKLVLGTHTGTHCDAPRHFVPGGGTVDEIPLDTLVGPAKVLDFSNAKPSRRMEVADFESQIGDSHPERVVMRFDWDDRWGTMSYYKDHPYISKEAARWLVDRGVVLLGMDTPMPDNPADGASSAEDSPIHKILLGAGVILLEYLCNLRALARSEIELIALPLKIRDGDGSPIRCMAIED